VADIGGPCLELELDAKGTPNQHPEKLPWADETLSKAPRVTRKIVTLSCDLD
jgi:hypothetical protein